MAAAISASGQQGCFHISADEANPENVIYVLNRHLVEKVIVYACTWSLCISPASSGLIQATTREVTYEHRCEYTCKACQAAGGCGSATGDPTVRYGLGFSISPLPILNLSHFCHQYLTKNISSNIVNICFGIVLIFALPGTDSLYI